MRPFRFLADVRSVMTGSELAAYAQRAEQLGFDTLVLPDHLIEQLSPVVMMSSAAAATSTLRVAAFVLNKDLRHPVVLAREAAAVDLLSDGRLELGLGAGHMKHEYDEAGIPFDAPKTRVARLGESVEILTRLFAGDEVSFTGASYTVRGHQPFPSPVQHPIPLLIGGNGRKVLTLAAQRASIVGFTGFSQVEGERSVNTTHFTDAGLAEQVGWVRAAAGDRFDGLELSVLVQGVVLTEHRRATADELRKLLPSLSVDDVLSSPYSLVGTASEIADQLEARRAALGVSYITVFEPDFEAMTSIIERLS